MKKFLCVLVFLISICLYGNPVSPTNALRVAENFLISNSGKGQGFSLADVTDQTDFQEFYIFSNTSGTGFVLVSADDCVQPILAYSMDNNIDFPLPFHIENFIEQYEAEIAFAKEHGVRATNEIVEQWSELLMGNYTPRNTLSVEPLLSTTWAQSPYYNDLCPMSDGVYTLTGCTATATAQIMKFWNWPETGTGSYTYTDPTFGQQSADFSSAHYNWDMMPNALTDSSSADEVTSVATLMYHLGVAVEMEYGFNGSSAFTQSSGYEDLPCAENALKKYFDYKNTLHSVYKDIVGDNVWISTLTAELNAGRPILESGIGTAGHAFVCDGYDNNGLFHINWGWGGLYDGYFAHNDLSPQGSGSPHYTFNDKQIITIGIEPNTSLRTNVQSLYLTNVNPSANITVKSNVLASTTWTASSDQEWLTVSPNQGAEAEAVTNVMISATPNNTGVLRSGMVTISQETDSLEILVYQSSCGEDEMCTLTFKTYDRFGDGWAGSSITVSSEDGFVYGMVGLPKSDSASQQVLVCPSSVKLIWNEGPFDNECYFTVMNDNDINLLTVPVVNQPYYTIVEPCTETPPVVSCDIVDLPFVETFLSTSETIACWQIVDANNDGYTFFIGDGKATYSYSSINAANDWLISPEFVLSGNQSMSFNYRISDANYSETFQVFMVQDSIVTAITEEMTVNNEIDEELVVDLSAYSGNSKIGIHCTSNPDMYELNISSFAINSSNEPSLEVNPTSMTFSTMVGESFTTKVASINANVLSEDITVTASTPFQVSLDGVNFGSSCTIPHGTIVTTADFYVTFSPMSLGSYIGEVALTSDTLISTIALMGTYFSCDAVTSFPFFEDFTDASSTRDCWQIVDANADGNTIFYDLLSDCCQVQVAGYQYSTVECANDWLISPELVLESNMRVSFDYITGSYPEKYSVYVIEEGQSYETATNVLPTQTVENDDFATQIVDLAAYANQTVRIAIKVESDADMNWIAFTNFLVDSLTTYTVIVTSADETMGTVTGGGVYNEGDTVMIEAIPNANYEFVQWNDDNTDNLRRIIVTQDQEFVATFQPVTAISAVDMNNISVYSHNNQIVVNNAEGYAIAIYNMAGQLIVSEASNAQATKCFTMNTTGIYLVRVGQDMFKKVIVTK